VLYGRRCISYALTRSIQRSHWGAADRNLPPDTTSKPHGPVAPHADRHMNHRFAVISWGGEEPHRLMAWASPQDGLGRAAWADTQSIVSKV
jgi:hypothetical protein